MQQAYPTDEQAKNTILEVGRRMYDKNYVVSNDGNISCKVSDAEVWATPTGVSKGFMTADMLVKVNLQGEVLEGTHRPSSEIKMHLAAYRANPAIRAVVHAHPVAATAMAVAGLALDAPILPEGIVQIGTVPVAPYANPGSGELAQSVVPFCKDHCAVLLANHGAVTWANDLMKAWMRMESLEYYAKITILTKFVLQQANELGPEQIALLMDTRTKLGIRADGC